MTTRGNSTTLPVLLLRMIRYSHYFLSPETIPTAYNNCAHRIQSDKRHPSPPPLGHGLYSSTDIKTSTPGIYDDTPLNKNIISTKNSGFISRMNHSGHKEALKAPKDVSYVSKESESFF